MEVKWIKLNVGMFDGNSFKKIKKAKIGGESFRDKLTAVWFELLDFAGKCNAGGQLVESPEIPFASIEDIAILIDRDPEELQLCMQFFVTNRMISVIDDVYMFTNWAKYQNEDGLEKIREQNRIRQKKWYDNQKQLANANLTLGLTLANATEEDKEEDKDLKNKNKNNKKKSSYSSAFVTILDDISDDELRSLYYEFIDMRKSIKSPITSERALKMLINKVNELEPGDTERQKKMLENAIVNNWKSVYPLKEETKKETPKASYDIDAYQERALHSDLTYHKKEKK